ncbi:MAG: YwbE family protein, partial [bacterium]|nr:YwbE family protein [bacterium]
MAVIERSKIAIGMTVGVVQKQHQEAREITTGRVLKILTKSEKHPHGIKVLLEG